MALSRGGNPRRIAASRNLQNVLRRLLSYMPKLGLLTETCQLLETAQIMETSHPQGPGAITEFDLIFETACRAITQCLAVSSAGWQGQGKKTSRRQADAALVDCLEATTEVLLHCWLTHSGGVRLSVLETVADAEQWRRLKRFIERYGGDLFSQHFMNFGNLRGILHQGVREYLETLRDEPETEGEFRLFTELDGAISLDEAAHWLSVAIEAVVENYGEYVDYNSITTQSDRGDMLYTLLDFLRLRAGYDRVAWNLRPVLLVHQTLVRCGNEGAARCGARGRRTDRDGRRREPEAFRQALPEIRHEAAEHRRPPGGTVRPAVGDRSALCLDWPGGRGSPRRPAPRRDRTAGGTDRPVYRGTARRGFELPGWLAALDSELDQLDWESGSSEEETEDPELRIQQVRLSRREVQRQINQMMATERFWPGDER